MARDDEESDNPEDRTSHAIASCVVALHDDREHGIGHADRDGEDGRTGKDDTSPVGSATPTTSTSTVTAGRHHHTDQAPGSQRRGTAMATTTQTATTKGTTKLSPA